MTGGRAGEEDQDGRNGRRRRCPALVKGRCQLNNGFSAAVPEPSKGYVVENLVLW